MEPSSNLPPLRVLDLFSGIGGFSVGLEATGGFETVAFCELEKYACRVLRRHWPDTPILGDVREVDHASLHASGLLPIDVICGGFPCQDLSVAGQGAGLAGARSGLWSEIARLACELRPRFVLVENVSALTFRGLGTVLGDLAAIGYDAEWHCIPASALGASHRRDRIWIVAYPSHSGLTSPGELGCLEAARGEGLLSGPTKHGGIMSDPNSFGRFDSPIEYRAIPILGGMGAPKPGAWPAEPGVGRMVDGIPCQLDRLRCLGNAIVPAVAEWIGRQILAAVFNRMEMGQKLGQKQ